MLLLRAGSGDVGTPTTPASQPAPTVPPAKDLIFRTVADSYVAAAEPTKNISDTPTLRIDGAPRIVALLQFDLRRLSRPIRDATLRIFALSDSRAGVRVRVARFGAWSERDMTYQAANRFANGAVASSKAFPANSWATADVTSLLSGAAGKIVTLVVSTAGPTNISFASREGGGEIPQLVIHVSGAAPATSASGTAEVLAAGDIGTCNGNGDEATGALLNANPDTNVLALGDLAYESGSPTNFADCYAPAWGAAKERTHPVPGNHEYGTSHADGYFEYFGAVAGPRPQGYYSFDIGAWHLIAINSNCSEVGGCGEGSPQERWVREDLARHPARCTLAFWHHPLFSSGQHGAFESMRPIWQALYDGGADIVLNGHDHDYERFAPQTPTGQPDPSRGIREFVVGTGGKSRRPFRAPVANSEARSDSVFGVLRLSLAPIRYEWSFVPAQGGAFSDSGSGDCH